MGSLNRVWILLWIVFLPLAPPRAEAVRADTGDEAAYVRLHIVNETAEPLYLTKLFEGGPRGGMFRYLREHYVDFRSALVPAGEKRVVECFGDIDLAHQGDLVFELGTGGMQRFRLSMRSWVSGLGYVHGWRLVNDNFDRWAERGEIVDTEKLSAVRTEERELYAANDYIIGLFCARPSYRDELRFSDVVLRIAPKEPRLADPEEYP